MFMFIISKCEDHRRFLRAESLRNEEKKSKQYRLAKANHTRSLFNSMGSSKCPDAMEKASLCHFMFLISFN